MEKDNITIAEQILFPKEDENKTGFICRRCLMKVQE